MPLHSPSLLLLNPTVSIISCGLRWHPARSSKQNGATLSHVQEVLFTCVLA